MPKWYQKQRKEPNKLKTLSRLVVFIKPYKRTFYWLIWLTLLLSVLSPLQPYFVQIAIDQHIALGNYNGLVAMTIVFVLVLIVQGVAQYYHTYFAASLGQNVIKDIRIQLYAYILRLRTSFFTKTPVGRLVTINVSDTETLAHFFSEGMAALIGDLLQILFMAVLMFYINWRLALLSLVTLPMTALLTYIFKEKIKEVLRIVRKAATQLNIFTQEHIMGMTMIQIFGRETHALDQFKSLNKAHQNASIKAIQYYARYFPLLSVIHALSISLLIGYGTQGVLRGTTTLGQLIAFLMYINLFFRPLHLIVDRFNTLQLGIVSIERIIQLLENGAQVADEGTYAPKHLQGAIAFQSVWFAYEGTNYVLQDISFEIAPNKSLAIVGATGAGKSTLINLLERFYDVHKGAILIDGINVKNYTRQALHAHIGLVLQDVFLFTGSIYENITLGNPNITRERVIEATQRIGIHDFILQLPGGYDYPVMERGMALSMGQRQLLAFVRVLVYEPRILILDEATATIDTTHERLIQKAMLSLMRDRTCLLIAHRLATVRHADSILVLRHGKIKEQGTHEELLSRQGYYAALYQRT